jgi:branched-chain amino acid transport system ATP-binding protein
MTVPNDSRNVLELRGVHAGYGRARVIHGVDLAVPEGSVVALLGANGAGKTTLLRVASGLLRPTAGKVFLGIADVTRQASHQRAKEGLCHITEGRAIFRSLSVRDNLELATPSWVQGSGFDRAIEIFPRLGDRLRQTAGSMSGGEQQMLALARAFLANPSVVLVDEVSIGLAPVVIDELFVALESLVASGVAGLMVDQYVHRAIAMADVVYLMKQGKIVFRGRSGEVDNDALMQAYLGLAST